MNPDSPRGRKRPTLRTQQREAARATIIDAAEELIAAKGLHGASIVDIAKLSGVAVGTLYNYFADRDHLVRTLFETRRASIRPQLQAAIEHARDLPFEPRLRQFVREAFLAFDAHRRFLKVVIETEHLKTTPSSTAQDMGRAIEDIVAAGVLEHQIEPRQARLVATILNGAIKAVVLRAITDSGAVSDAADELVSVILDGARRT